MCIVYIILPTTRACQSCLWSDHEDTQSIKDEKLPMDLKTVAVSPIFKKGDKNVAANYRPISLTSIICKLMESFIKEPIITHSTNEKPDIQQIIRIYHRKIHNISASQFCWQMSWPLKERFIHIFRLLKSIRHSSISATKEKA